MAELLSAQAASNGYRNCIGLAKGRWKSLRRVVAVKNFAQLLPRQKQSPFIALGQLEPEDAEHDVLRSHELDSKDSTK
jgi:hypothetical protein